MTGFHSEHHQAMSVGSGAGAPQTRPVPLPPRSGGGGGGVSGVRGASSEQIKAPNPRPPSLREGSRPSPPTGGRADSRLGSAPNIIWGAPAGQDDRGGLGQLDRDQ